MAEIADEVELPVYAGTIVVSADGRILCQLRDDKPEIKFPGFWTCTPGGHVERGESPHSAALRELREEFEIEVSGLAHLITFVEHDNSVRGVYHAYTAKLTTPIEQLRCNEGQCASFFELDEICQTLRLHPISLKIFKIYLDSRDIDHISH